MTPERRKAVLDPAAVRPPNPDPRDGKRDPKHVRALAKDILTRGLRNPPYVRMVDGVPTIVTGEHRRLAMVELGWSQAEFYLLEAELTAAQVAIEQLQESQLHARFSPLQKVAAIRMVMEAEGLNRGQFVERHGDLLGLDEAGLSKLFRTSAICPHLRAVVDSGELGVSSAYLIATIPDGCAAAPDTPTCTQREFAAKCLSGAWKRDALDHKVRQHLKGTGKGRKRPPVSVKSEGGVVFQYAAEATVEKLLTEIAGFVERVKKAVKKGDVMEDLPFLLRRG